MSEHTPTTERIRSRYGDGAISAEGQDNRLSEFDRWLAAHDAALLREVADELFSGGEPDDVDDMPDQQFYDMRTAQWLRAKANERSGR